MNATASTDSLPDWYRASWKVTRPRPLSQWADEERYLSLESNPLGGRWHTSTVPYLREVMDTISSGRYRRIFCMFCSQAAKTETINNVIGWAMTEAPGPILLVQETVNNARAWAKERFEPMLRDTPCLRGKVSRARGIAAQEEVISNEALHKSFPGGSLTAVGANSPAGLDMRPIRYAIGDEWDAWAPSAGEEGDQYRLMEKRLTWYDWLGIAIMVMISSPRLKATSRIEPAYLGSDQRKYLVPCWHCEFYQELTWQNFIFRERDADGMPIAEAIHFPCQHCQRPIWEKHRPAMLNAGKWRAKYPGREHAGFHLWAGYCPPVSWYTIAKEHVEDHQHPEKYKVFVNTRRAETWEEKYDAPAWETIKARADDTYTQWTVPDGVGFLIAAGDVQEDRIEYSVWGFGRAEESWLIGHDVVWGNTDLDDPYLAFEQQAFQRLAQPSRGRTLQPLLALLDSGAKTQQVYHFARTRPYIYAIKGSSQQFAPVAGAPTWQDIDYRGQKIKDGVQLWPIGVHRIKKLLYGRLKLPKPGPRFLHTPYDVPDEYYRQLTAEKLITHPTGREEFKREGRNETLDCATYAYAGAVLAGLTDPRMDWDKLCPRSAPTATASQPAATAAPVQLPGPSAPVAPAGRRRMRRSPGVMGRLLG